MARAISAMPKSSVKKCGAEFIGTFALVFAGTGAIVINETSNGAITHVGIALTFGLIVLAIFLVTPFVAVPAAMSRC